MGSYRFESIKMEETVFKKILAATDGSRHAEKGVALATDLADKYRARLLLLHVLPAGEPTAEEKRMARAEGIAKKTTPTRVGRLEATPHGPYPLPAGEHEEVEEFEQQRLDEERQRMQEKRVRPHKVRGRQKP